MKNSLINKNITVHKKQAKVVKLEEPKTIFNKAIRFNKEKDNYKIGPGFYDNN